MSDRGIHYVNGGKGELQLAKQFKSYSDTLRHKYTYVSTNILDKIAADYEYRAQVERQRAELE